MITASVMKELIPYNIKIENKAADYEYFPDNKLL